MELLLEKSTKVHKVDVQPRDGEDKVLLDQMPQERLLIVLSV